MVENFHPYIQLQTPRIVSPSKTILLIQIKFSSQIAKESAPLNFKPKKSAPTFKAKHFKKAFHTSFKV